VKAIVEEQTEGEKVIVFKKKRRKNYRRHNGFRASITTLRMKEIIFDHSTISPDAQNITQKAKA
jgi:large subunit ribosomal protein L21